jgi:cyclophilin family peptidyl-prolyl cis-trans isomerase
MARTGEPDSATTQFFINIADNTKSLGPGGADTYGYAVFGRVVSGMDIVDAMSKVQTTTWTSSEKSLPLESVRDALIITNTNMASSATG